MSYGVGTDEFRMGVPRIDFDDWSIGTIYGFLWLMLLLWPLVLAVVLTYLLVGVVVGLFYLAQQIPDERYEAAGRWATVRVRRCLGWLQGSAQSLVVKASAAHPSLAKWRRHFIAWLRGRPLPATERIRRR